MYECMGARMLPCMHPYAETIQPFKHTHTHVYVLMYKPINALIHADTHTNVIHLDSSIKHFTQVKLQ